MEKMSKKADIEIQFNWIFVMIAGAIILSFFVFTVMRQRDISQQSMSASLINSLETEITAARVSSGTITKLDLNNLQILFSCDDYRVGDVGQSVSYRSVFSPDLVKGDDMVLWSMPWYLPFKVTNLLFITSPGVRYVLISNNASSLVINSVYKRMSDKFLSVEPPTNEEKFGNIKSGKGYKLKFVCVDCDFKSFNTRNLSSYPDSDVRAVSIHPSSNSVDFYVMSGDSFALDGSSYFFGIDDFGEATLYAAIFADTKENYDCNMKKALKSFSIVSSVYVERMSGLETSSYLPDYCKAFYSSESSPSQDLNSMIGIVGRVNDSITSAGVNDLLKYANDLKLYQDNYVRRQSCPLIY
jgi:hypothetical protein